MVISYETVNIMKSTIIGICLLFTLTVTSQEKHVLFLGNSYTASNNLPGIVGSIAESMEDILVYETNTPGGYTLQGHSTNNTSINLISQGGWDYVVLQEQSQLPSFSINQVENETFPFAGDLNELIEEFNPCGETMFYMTWGRENGDAGNCENWPPVCTYEGMDDLLAERYLTMTEDNEAVVSPVGKVWRYVRENYPEIQLYSTDGSHPSQTGSYLAGVTFYTAIYRENPLNIPFNYTLSEGTAAIIKEAAKEVVYDNFSDWSIGEFDLTSEFSVEDSEGLTIQLINESQNATNLLWTINGEEFTDENVSYTFDNEGIYTISLEASNSCGNTVSSEDIMVGTVGVNEQYETSFPTIYPNPITDMLFISGVEDIESLEILDSNGKVLKSLSNSTNNVSMSGYPNGIYIVRISTNQSVFVRKVSVLN